MLLGVAGAALAARLAHVAFIRGHPFWEMAEAWPASDMHQFLAWARHLAAGDWLDRETFRPWFDYQAAIAPPEVWQAWYGPHVYYQPPLYPYLLAAVLAITGSVDLFRLGQIFLGALACGLMARVAARAGGEAAGWFTGLAAALYAPFIFYDAELLRGTLVLATQATLLLALLRWHDAPAARMAGWCGAAFGVAWLADPAVLLFGPLAVGWMIVVSRRAPGRRGGGPSGGRPFAAPLWFCAGAAAALLPLAARNAWVGAPLLSSTTRAPLAFVMGNAPDARPAGAHVPPSAGAILRASNYRMGATVRETLAAYQGRYGELAGKQAEKLSSLWSAYEVPDNPSFYYGARVSPVVRFGLRFLPVAALGLVGLALALYASTREADARAALLVCFVAATLAVFLLAHVNSRYRQPLAMALLMLCGLAVSWGWRRGAMAGGSVAVAALLLLLLLPKGPPEGYGYGRPAEYVLAARLYQQRGDPDGAEAELRAAISAARAEEIYRAMVPTLLYELGTAQAAAGRTARARESFQAVLREDPGFVEAREALRSIEPRQDD
jgi:tetratricopeptide (TPR) repeat protein